MQFNLLLFAAIAFFTFSQTTFGGDEAAKFLTPVQIFWLKYGCGACSAILLAVKMYCSTSFADYMTKKKADDNTKFFVSSDSKPTV